jgi:hypothetical protein
MTAFPSLSSTGSDSTAAARTDRTTVAVAKALQETKREGQAMVRLIEGASGSSKGQVVDYRA